MSMKKDYNTIEELIKQNLDTKEDVKTFKLMKELKDVKKRGDIFISSFLALFTCFCKLV